MMVNMVALCEYGCPDFWSQWVCCEYGSCEYGPSDLWYFGRASGDKHMDALTCASLGILDVLHVISIRSVHIVRS